MRIAIALCLLVSGVAAADNIDWDGTYASEDDSGSGLCGYFAAGATVTVANSAFSVAWNIRRTDDNQVVRVGTIEGTVRPSGIATAKATVTEPMPREAAAALAQQDETPAKLHAVADDMKVTFRNHGTRERVIVIASGFCSTSFAATGTPPAKAAAVTAAAAPAAGPKPPPLAPGAPGWDVAYLGISRFSQDEWRCPARVTDRDLAVSHGRFSLPYVVESRTGNITVGQIEGRIAASGAVTLRTWLAISALPPELADGGKATIEQLRALPLKMTFERSHGRRLALLTSGNDCELHFEGSDTFVPGRSVSAPHDLPPGAACASSASCKSGFCSVDNRCK